MIEFDWIYVPEGSFTYGLSEAQREKIRTLIREQVGYEQLSPQEQSLIEKTIEGYQRETALIRANWDHPSGVPFAPESNEFKELRRRKGLGQLLSVEYNLLKIPPPFTTPVGPFYISRFPVTELQMGEFYRYFGLTRDFPLSKRDECNRPEAVSPAVADMFCHWIGAVLPVASSWEYVARGPESFLYPWGNEWDPSKGNFPTAHGPRQLPEQAQGYGLYTPVDAYPEGASPFGAFDMAGNMPEWTRTISYDGSMWAMGHNVRRPSQPEWYYYMVFHHSFGGMMRVGFRPLMSEWHCTTWPGF